MRFELLVGHGHCKATREHYREAVTQQSPGLSRFAATLGTRLGNDRQPQRGCDTVSQVLVVGLLCIFSRYPQGSLEAATLGSVA